MAAVVKLAHALGLQVIAEGVETERQLDALVRLDCDFAQGYLFSRPVPAHELVEKFPLPPGAEPASLPPRPRRPPGLPARLAFPPAWARRAAP